MLNAFKSLIHFGHNAGDVTLTEKVCNCVIDIYLSIRIRLADVHPHRENSQGGWGRMGTFDSEVTLRCGSVAVHNIQCSLTKRI